MSIKVSSWVWDEAGITDRSELLVLLVLADMSDNEGVVGYASRQKRTQKSLAALCRMGVSTFREKVSNLIERGIIATSQEGRNDPYEYRIVVPWTADSERQEPAVATARNRASDRQNLAVGAPESGGRSYIDGIDGTDDGVRGRKSTPSAEKPPVVPQDDGFDAIWQSWPRKDSKKAAQARWSRLSAKKREEITPLIVAHANAFRQNVPPLYVPYLTSFLKDERWDDPLAVSRERGAYKPEPQAPTQRVIPQGHIPVRDQNGQIIGSRPS